jgi:hypothetical protein
MAWVRLYRLEGHGLSKTDNMLAAPSFPRPAIVNARRNPNLLTISAAVRTMPLQIFQHQLCTHRATDLPSYDSSRRSIND